MANADHYKSTAQLIANAVTAARVFGENRRVTQLVASSVGRFAAELDAGGDDAGDGLVEFALETLGEGAEHAPGLHAALKVLADARS
jgi:hypothetical protein